MRLARGVVGDAVGFEGIQARTEDAEIMEDREWEWEWEKDYHNLQSRTQGGDGIGGGFGLGAALFFIGFVRFGSDLIWVGVFLVSDHPTRRVME